MKCRRKDTFTAYVWHAGDPLPEDASPGGPHRVDGVACSEPAAHVHLNDWGHTDLYTLLVDGMYVVEEGRYAIAAYTPEEFVKYFEVLE